MDTVIELLKQEMGEYKGQHIDAVLTLLEAGNTIPFIARYRKEMTGSMDEVVIQTIAQRHQYLQNLQQRKTEIIRLIDEQGKLTDALHEDILQASVLNKLEDLYRPYKQKKRTKATLAKERGLEPLALKIWNLPSAFSDAEASAYIDAEKDLETLEAVYEGVHEILAERIGDEPAHREWIRDYFLKSATLTSSIKDESLDERKVYEMYYVFTQPLKTLQAHRILAMNRGEKEGVLKIGIAVDEDRVATYFARSLLGNRQGSACADIMIRAYTDAYKRFIKPAIEREIRNQLTERAEHQAVEVFGENLRHLLLQAPLKGKVILGFDPAYRTGCKLAIVDETGKVLAIDVIYPHPPAPQAKQQVAKAAFRKLVERYHVDTVAIGNGTASRESEVFVSDVLKDIRHPVQYVIVNEAGASVYSASEAARDEFPDLQVEQRSAVSIARRLQDPLAELVKIDPKSVGVGQYQHDVTQKYLNERLTFVVETAVNQVGVDVNTASVALLEYVSGLSKTTAKNIVKFRESNGEFKNRSMIQRVPRLGPKSFEQAIGFLRIPQGENVLDNTSIHPESYDVVMRLLKDNNLKTESLGSETARSTLMALKPREISETYHLGHETLKDILDALVRPGRDMRDSMNGPLLRSDVLTMEDLKPGMELKGTVRNVVDFGAFVDIGVKQDGMVHISKLSKAFVKHPTDVVAVGDIVTVWVEDVNLQKQRIQLTMLAPNAPAKH